MDTQHHVMCMEAIKYASIGPPTQTAILAIIALELERIANTYEQANQ